MKSRRLDDRLRDLCAKVVRVPESEVEPLLKELQAVIHEKIERMRSVATARLAVGPPLHKERRRLPPD